MTARALTAYPRDDRFYLYPDERVWTNPFIQGRYDFLMDGARLLDTRIYMHFYATGITPAMAIRNVGKGWNTVFRLHGPLDSFYDQTWKPGDPERVE